MHYRCSHLVTLIVSYRFVSLFVYRYCDHRDLHSFPTRRSSDLKVGADEGRNVSRRGHAPALRALPEEPRDLRPKSNVDRKSTRLNSSHLGISYAVFCLKKKKKKKIKELTQ